MRRLCGRRETIRGTPWCRLSSSIGANSRTNPNARTWTMAATSRDRIAPSTTSGVSSPVSGDTSQKMGSAPAARTACAVGGKVNDGSATPPWMPSASSAAVSPEVQFETTMTSRRLPPYDRKELLRDEQRRARSS